MHSEPPTAELEERIHKARAAVGALELMDTELAVIAKAGALRYWRPQITEIRKAVRTLISSLERTANQSEAEFKRRQRRMRR